MSQGPTPERRTELIERQRKAFIQMRDYSHKLYHNQIDAGHGRRTAPEELKKQMRIADKYMLRRLCQPQEPL